MTLLLVMRHAKSDWSTGHSDHERPLNPRGEQAADTMAQWLADSGYCPDHIITSSARRTQQTVAAVRRLCALDDDSIDVDGDLYLASAHTWLTTANQTGHHLDAECLLLCGHNRGFDVLVDDLSNGAAPLSASGKLMATAAVAVFEVPDWASFSSQTATFVEIVRPRELS